MVDGICSLCEIGVGGGREKGKGRTDIGEEEVGVAEERSVLVEEGGIMLVEESGKFLEEFGVIGFAETRYKHVDVGSGEEISALILRFHFFESCSIIGGLKSEEEPFESVSIFHFGSGIDRIGAWLRGMKRCG